MNERADPTGDALSALSALGEPNRRALYDYVTSRGGWVSRDEAADAVGLERGTAAHHLDRLASDGLLEIDYRRLTGRQGPGAGRPAKLYRRARREFGVSLPPRRYDLAGRLLAEAADSARTGGDDIDTALANAARGEGRRLAREVREKLRGITGRTRSARRSAAVDALRRLGYEPVVCEDGSVALRNCPFHHLADEHTELICGMNLCLLDAAVDELGHTGLRAELDPEEGLCCVKLRPAR